MMQQRNRKKCDVQIVIARNINPKIIHNPSQDVKLYRLTPFLMFCCVHDTWHIPVSTYNHCFCPIFLPLQTRKIILPAYSPTFLPTPTKKKEPLIHPREYVSGICGLRGEDQGLLRGGYLGCVPEKIVQRLAPGLKWNRVSCNIERIQH